MASGFLVGNKAVQYAVGAVAIVAGIYLILRLRGKIRESQNSVETVFSNAELVKVVQQNATITKARASQLAEQIKSSWGFLNDDENAIYNVFKALNNEYDLALLIQVYTYKGENLQESITKRMSQNERNKITEILYSKGIESSF